MSPNNRCLVKEVLPGLAVLLPSALTQAVSQVSRWEWRQGSTVFTARSQRRGAGVLPAVGVRSSASLPSALPMLYLGLRGSMWRSTSVPPPPPCTLQAVMGDEYPGGNLEEKGLGT